MAKIDPNSDYYSELSQFTIESDVDAILWIDAESTIYRVNQAACQLLQYSPEELVGKNLDDLIDIQNDWNKTDPHRFLDQIDIIKQKWCHSYRAQFPYERRSDFDFGNLSAFICFQK